MAEKCRIKDEELIELFYGESSDPGLEVHAAACAECARKLAGMKAVTGVIESSRMELPREAWDLHTRGVMARIKKSRQLKIKMPSFIKSLFASRLVLTGAAAFAAVVFVAGAGLLFNQKTKVYDRDRAVLERIEMFENMEVLERLDFYSRIAGDGL